MTGPLVSVIIPAFNAEAYLEKAVQSVLQQSLSDLEVIIVDDGSTDGTMSVILSLEAKDRRVRYFCCHVNSGPGYARNIGIVKSRGEWLTMLDADDWYDTQRLEKLIAAVDAAGVDLAADNQRFIAGKTEKCKNLLTTDASNKVESLTIFDYFDGDRISRSSRNLGLLKPMIRNKLLKRHIIRYEQRKGVTFGEDFYFLLECIKLAKRMAYITEPLYNYRIDAAQSLTARLNIDGLIAWKKMHERYIYLFNPKLEVRELELMQKRGLGIELYINLRRLVEPLKQGRYRDFLRQVRLNPRSALTLLVKNLSKDPSAIVLLLRYLFSNTIQKGRDLFTRFLKPFNTQRIRFGNKDLDAHSGNEKK